MQSYLAEQPFLAVPWADLRFVSENLHAKFEAIALPSLAVVSLDRTRVNCKARVVFEHYFSDAYPFIDPVNKPPVGPDAKKPDIDVSCQVA